MYLCTRVYVNADYGIVCRAIEMGIREYCVRFSDVRVKRHRREIKEIGVKVGEYQYLSCVKKHSVEIMVTEELDFR